MCGHVSMSVEMTGREKQYVCAPAGLLENIYPGGVIPRVTMCSSMY